MGFPDRDVAVDWVGRTVVDREGVVIGACTAVFADDATELVEWVCAELAGGVVVIPAGDAGESGGQVRVAVSHADVAGAPAVGGSQHITEDEEAALYRHYGIPVSRDASPSLLPADDADLAADAAAPDAVTPVTGTPDTVSPYAAVPDAAVPVDVTPDATAPVGDAPVTAPGVEADPASEGWYPPLDDAPAPSRGRRGAVLAAGGLAGLALAVVAVLRSRRDRTPPSTARVQQLVDRGRAASLALGARTSQVAPQLVDRGRAASLALGARTSQAAPQLRSAKQVVLCRAAGIAGTAAAALTAAAYGGAQDPDDPTDPCA